MNAQQRSKKQFRVLLVNDCAEENNDFVDVVNSVFGKKALCCIATNEEEIRQSVWYRPHVIVVGDLAIFDETGAIKNVHRLLTKYGVRWWRSRVTPIHRLGLAQLALSLFPRPFHRRVRNWLMADAQVKQLQETNR